MNNRKGSLKSKKTKGKSAKPPIRKKACLPPKSWFDLSDQDYNPNGNPTILSPYMQKFVKGIHEGARKKEEKLIKLITMRVVGEITMRIEKGIIKLPEKMIEIKLNRKDLNLKEDWLETLRRHQDYLFSPIGKSSAKPSKKK